MSEIVLTKHRDPSNQRNVFFIVSIYSGGVLNQCCARFFTANGARRWAKANYPEAGITVNKDGGRKLLPELL